MIVELVKAGFLGFAVILIGFSFNLLKQLIERPCPEVEVLKIRVYSVLAFMVLSIITIGLGLYYEFSNPHVKVNFNLTPNNPKDVRITVEGEELNATSIYLSRDKNGIQIDFYKLIQENEQFRQDLVSKTEDLKEYTDSKADKMINEGLEL